MNGYLFRGGPIYPMDRPGALDDGVLLTRGRSIAYVGPRAGLPDEARRAEVIELDGRALLPGLCDSHLHLVLAAVEHAALDCRGADPRSLEDFVRARAARAAPGEWITGFGWERRLVFPGSEPGPALLDRAAPRNPVFLVSKDAHSALLSSTGLQRLATLEQRPERCVVRADQGLVLEEVFELRRRLIPEPGPDEKRARLAPFIRALHACGITAVHSNEPPDHLALARAQLEGAGGPRVRVLWNPAFDSPGALRRGRALFATRVPGWLRVGGAKLFLDGTLGSLSAALTEPYVGTTDRGMLTLSPAELDDWLAAIHAVGTHAVIHVIGDRAAEVALDALARIDWPAGTRHRLEHVQILPRRSLAPGSLAGVVLSVQPSHMWDDRGIAERHLAPELQPLAYALRSMLRGGGLLVFGSDAPVEGVDPWRGIAAAVTRLADQSSPPWVEEERLTLHEALAAHTAGPAALHGFATGVLAPGRLADLVVLGDDPFARDPSDLARGVPAEMTFVDGEVVFRR